MNPAKFFRVRCPACKKFASSTKHRCAHGRLCSNCRVCSPLKAGPIARELWRLKDKSLEEIYGFRSRKQHGMLSEGARRVLGDAFLVVCGYRFVNSYYRDDAMSEAIEAAEALGI